MLNFFRRRSDKSEPAASLYGLIVEQARAPVFFTELGVPDTVIGRFEMIALHAFLVFHRLRDLGQEGRDLAQATHDLMFVDMDRSLRELGIGDMGIGKRVKLLARNLYGRIAAYEAGLESGEPELSDALARNVYATAQATQPERIAVLAAYLRREADALRYQEDSLLAGRVIFGAPPGDGTAKTELPE